MVLLPWEEDIPPRILKLIRLGLEEGWHNYTSLVARFQRPPDPPFFASWRLTPENKWAFDMARARKTVSPYLSLAPLSARDIAVYLQDPTVIQEEDPDGAS